MKRLSTPLVALALFAAAILPLAQGCKKKPPPTVEETRPPIEQPAQPETRVAPPRRRRVRAWTPSPKKCDAYREGY